MEVILAVLQLAQADGPPITPTTIVGAFITVSLALVGLVGWIMRHVFLKTIPDIIADAKEQRKADNENTNELCQTFTQSNQAERALCEKNFALVNVKLDAIAAIISQEAKAGVAQIEQHVTNEAGKYRHDLIDKLNEAVLGREVWLAQQAARKAKEP